MFKLVNIFYLAFFVFLISCGSKENPSSSNEGSDEAVSEGAIVSIDNLDIDEIIERGKIIAVVENSSSGFFIYRGKSLGFQYELLVDFAGSLDVELELLVTPNIEQAFQWLDEGKADLIAFPLTVTRERKKNYLMTNSHYTIKQVLVQRKPKNWRDLKIHEIENSLIRNQVDLIGKRVHYRYQTSFDQTLKSLSNSIGGDILIVQQPPGEETQDIFKKVSSGEIDYAISDEDIAVVLSNIYPNIDVNTPLSFPTQIAWAVGNGSPHLRDTVNYWLNRIQRRPTYNVIYNKYFRYRPEFSVIAKEVEELDISEALELGFFKAADTVGWDWRLLLSQVYQESKFNEKAKSWAGAVGLMQVMPTTARMYGVRDVYDPKRNLYAGTMHLLWLKEQWSEIEDPLLKIKFMLASYNVGLGHLQDVQALARKYGEDPYEWEVVEKYLILKKKPKYFNDPVVKYGYCRGNEPVNYVRNILSRYNRYKQVYPAADSVNLEESTD